MSLLIQGLGTAVPPHAITQAQMAAAALPCSCTTARQRKLLPVLYRRTSVETRYSVVLNQETPNDPPQRTSPQDRMLAFYPPAAHADDRGPTMAQRMKHYPSQAIALAAAACRDALDEANVSPDQISQLVVVSCTGFSAPGVDIGLIDTLKLPPTTGRTTIGFMGCHGAMNGLRVANALTQSDPNAHVLMCCVELCTLHFQYGWDPQQVVANALFADGAAAVVGRASTSVKPAAGRSPAAGSTIQPPTESPSKLPGAVAGAGAGAAPMVVSHGSLILPDDRDLMTWLIRDHGFEMTLSPQVPGRVKESLADWFTPWLADQGLTVDQIRGWAIHPGGPRVIAAVEEALNLFPGAGDPSRHILQTHGNMSSPTVLFILNQLRQTNTPRPWIAIAFGPGLTIEATLIR